VPPDSAESNTTSLPSGDSRGWAAVASHGQPMHRPGGIPQVQLWCKRVPPAGEHEQPAHRGRLVVEVHRSRAQQPLDGPEPVTTPRLRCWVPANSTRPVAGVFD